MELRRTALAVIPALGSALGSALSAAQQSAKVARVGCLGSGSAPTPATPSLAARPIGFRDRAGRGELIGPIEP